MPIKFTPNYTITPEIVHYLLRIEAVKERVIHLPLTPIVLASLRETARLFTTHYSTMIEGNALSPDEVENVLKHEGHFPGRQRDEKEVKGYYAALKQVEQWAAQGIKIQEKHIQTLHALVMANGRSKVKPSPYRDGQNVIRDGRSGGIIYLPPEAKDVAGLMEGMVDWINKNRGIPCPIIASIAHYQFATIHPYYDGNGRTARLLTTLILHLGGYDLKGLYSLEEYYARHLETIAEVGFRRILSDFGQVLGFVATPHTLKSRGVVQNTENGQKRRKTPKRTSAIVSSGLYYDAISIGDSHNYYLGRAEADITKWVDYFLKGMAIAFENVLKQMSAAGQGDTADQSARLKQLDQRQRQALQLFEEYETVTAKQIGDLFGFKTRSSSQLCQTWVEVGFLEIADFSNKGRKYRLAKQWRL